MKKDTLKRMISWCKKEAVLTVSMILAVGSAFIVHPDQEYIGYIDFRTLGILFSLMAVMAGVQKLGLFDFVGEKLLKRISTVKGLVLILVMLCFFGSMIITNDVALITFVPFTFIVFRLVFPEGNDGLLVGVVVMQTIAANLGSMLTPIGNPQNLYLYGKMNMGLGAFLKLMLPYTVLSFFMLMIWCLTLHDHGKKQVTFTLEKNTSLKGSEKQLIVYGILFVLCIGTVAHIIPYEISLLAVLIIVWAMDRSVLVKVDYSLLLTFVGFFIFIGNMGRVPVFRNLLSEIIVGNEIMTSIVASQVMSNVPTALLLSGFSKQYALLVVGTNLGGLGTLIASMASLISFKYLGKEYAYLKGNYVRYFTVANIMFLAVLTAMAMLLYL